IAADKTDLASLGKDLAVLRARGLYACEMSSSRKVAPTQRKRHAESVRSHADKLLSALSPAHEFDTRVGFLSLFCSHQHDKGPKAIGELLLSLRFLIRDADQIISEANAEIPQGRKAKKPLESSPPPLDSLGSLFSRYNPPETVSWTIAWELAPFYKNHFCKNATASTPSEASKDRTPRGPFVRFVQAVQQNLDVFPGQDAVSPHTIASALARTKSQRLAWTKSRRDEEARIDAILGKGWRRPSSTG
ncbi:MAG: hypothetical protein WA624_22740, partial [Methylocella sp.]